MLKKEIIKAIDNNILIKNNEDILDITKYELNISGVPRKCDKDESEWFPEVEGLKEEFDVLKREVVDTKNRVDIAKNELKNLKCDCKVRLYYNALFMSYSKCVLCGKTFNDENVINGNTIYNSKNRNRQCVMIKGEYEDDDVYCAGYKKEGVYPIIKNILKDKMDDEEINFINEFKKLNLIDVKIDEREFEKEYYVLIIGGSNKHYINDNIYVAGKTLLNEVDIAKFLCGIPNVYVEILENSESLDSSIFNKKFPYKGINNVRIDGYDTIEQLKKIIDQEKNVPFDLIIDASNLFKYDNNDIVSYNLSLKDIFKDSTIIKIENGNIKKQKEFLGILKEKLVTYNNAYIHLNDQYYYLNKEEMDSLSINDTCQNIKKMLLKK